MQTLTLSCAAACLVFAGNALAADVPADLVGHSFKLVTDTSIHANMLRENRVLDDVSDGKGESIWPSTTAGGVLRCAMDAQNFNSADAPAEAVSLRRAALQRLSTQFAERFARSVAMRQAAAQGRWICSSPAPTACLSSTAPICASTCRWPALCRVPTA